MFCYNDAAAMVALNYCQKKGLRVPEDVAIAGFDDIDLSSHVSPALTTLVVDKEALGKQAVELLVSPPKKNNVLLPVQLKLRASC